MISENLILPDDKVAACSNAVKLTVGILHKEGYKVGERTDEMNMSPTETVRKDEATINDLEADASSDHEQEAATLSLQRLLARQKRRVQNRSAQQKARQQRTRR